jgi:hypothetical protein
MTQTTQAAQGDKPAPPQQDKDDWLAKIDEVGEEAGYFQTLGHRHWAFFSDESPVLLVTFETADAVRATEDGLPMGHALASSRGWSHLCLIADGETWYRDPAVFRYFDRLVDDAFFEDFDRVVFYGAGMGGYAACAFSVAAPGATVIAVQPVATLDPSVTGWDPRHSGARRLSFTDRYGYAPDLTEGAGDLYLLFDPEEPLDAMHAALFLRPYALPLRCRFLGASVEKALTGMEILPQLILAAGDGTLTPGLFRRLFRKRRRYGPYLRALLARAEAEDRPGLAALLARNVTARLHSPRFRQRLDELTARGITLPPQRSLGHP